MFFGYVFLIPPIELKLPKYYTILFLKIAINFFNFFVKGFFVGALTHFFP